jgi:hypothetical protein
LEKSSFYKAALGLKVCRCCCCCCRTPPPAFKKRVNSNDNKEEEEDGLLRDVARTEEATRRGGARATKSTAIGCNFAPDEKKMRLVFDRENLPVETVEITIASDAVR